MVGPKPAGDQQHGGRAQIHRTLGCGVFVAHRSAAALHALDHHLARLPEDIRGYGHVKARHLAAVRGKWQTLMQAWRQPQAQRAAA